MQQVDRFRELYLTEQEQKLDAESELKDCKVIMFCKFVCSLSLFWISILSQPNFLLVDEFGEK